MLVSDTEPWERVPTCSSTIALEATPGDLGAHETSGSLTAGDRSADLNLITPTGHRGPTQAAGSGLTCLGRAGYPTAPCASLIDGRRDPPCAPF